MKTVHDLSQTERQILVEFQRRIREAFPDWTVRMTLFRSRARGEAQPDSDMDLLLEVEKDHVSLAEKRVLRHMAGELSMESGIILTLFVADRCLRRERGEFSIFRRIREEGIPA